MVNPLKILVTGSGGLLGSAFVKIAALRHDVYSTHRRHLPPAGIPIKLDLTDFNAIKRALEEIKPDVILHAAALTNVDLCEREKELALRVNYEATARIAEISEKLGSFMVYISTDYVFDGEKGLYKEEDIPNPINFYGYSKLKGEQAIRELVEGYCIARASVIYGSKPAGGKVNFALWLFEKLRKNEELNILVDQYVSPTLNTNLAEMLLEIIERELKGTYHLSGAERVSRYQFASELCEVFGFDRSLLKPISMSDIKWIARRPRDSSLDVSKAKRILNNKPLNLRDSLLRLKRELSNVTGGGC